MLVKCDDAYVTYVAVNIVVTGRKAVVRDGVAGVLPSSLSDGGGIYDLRGGLWPDTLVASPLYSTEIRRTGTYGIR